MRLALEINFLDVFFFRDIHQIFLVANSWFALAFLHNLKFHIQAIAFGFF